MVKSSTVTNLLAALGIPVSCSAMVWLVLYGGPPLNRELLIGWTLAAICCIVTLLLCWETIRIYFAARMNRESGAFASSYLAFFAAFFLLAWFGHGIRERLMGDLMGAMFWAKFLYNYHMARKTNLNTRSNNILT